MLCGTISVATNKRQNSRKFRKVVELKFQRLTGIWKQSMSNVNCKWWREIWETQKLTRFSDPGKSRNQLQRKRSWATPRSSMSRNNWVLGWWHQWWCRCCGQESTSWEIIWSNASYRGGSWVLGSQVHMRQQEGKPHSGDLEFFLTATEARGCERI